LGCAYRSVAYWRINGDPQNLESLKDKRGKGNHREVTNEYIDLLLIVIGKDASEMGYEFGKWTSEKLSKVDGRTNRNKNIE
jgi:hypothetical protein